MRTHDERPEVGKRQSAHGVFEEQLRPREVLQMDQCDLGGVSPHKQTHALDHRWQHKSDMGYDMNWASLGSRFQDSEERVGRPVVHCVGAPHPWLVESDAAPLAADLRDGKGHL